MAPLSELESSYLSFGRELGAKLDMMRIPDNGLQCMGGKRYFGDEVFKEADSSFKPPKRRDGADWPTLVVQSGLPESLERLRYDARWWLTNPKGQAKIAIIFSIRPQSHSIIIEKWELLPATSPRQVTNATELPPIPAKIQEITIFQGKVVGAPLLLSFEKIFLRPAVLPEGDFIFDAEELSIWAEDLWKFPNFSNFGSRYENRSSSEAEKEESDEDEEIESGGTEGDGAESEGSEGSGEGGESEESEESEENEESDNGWKSENRVESGNRAERDNVWESGNGVEGDNVCECENCLESGNGWESGSAQPASSVTLPRMDSIRDLRRARAEYQWARASYHLTLAKRYQRELDEQLKEEN